MVPANAATPSFWARTEGSRIYLFLLPVLTVAVGWLWFSRSQSTAERGFALAIGAFAVVAFVPELWACISGGTHPVVRAFSLLSAIIAVFIGLCAASAKLWWESMPVAVIWTLLALFGFIVIYYLLYISGAGVPTHIGSWSILKGFGGATFAEFAGGVGVLVSIGIYHTDPITYWWLAQFGAMISLFSAAAWVQRYVLEETASFDEARRIVANGFSRTLPNFLNSLAALTTMLAILVPTQSGANENASGNIPALNNALPDNQGLVFVIWLVVLILWIVSAAWPLIRRRIEVWRTNPPGHEGQPPWLYRDSVKPFLWLILIFAFVALLALIVSWNRLGTTTGPIDAWWKAPWPDAISQWLSVGAAGLFVVGIGIKWLVDRYEEQQGSELKMLMVFRDIALLGCGLVVLAAQIWQPTDLPWSTLYSFVLGLMGYSTLTGILIGAYRWSKKRELHRAEAARAAHAAPGDIAMANLRH